MALNTDSAKRAYYVGHIVLFAGRCREVRTGGAVIAEVFDWGVGAWLNPKMQETWPDRTMYSCRDFQDVNHSAP